MRWLYLAAAFIALFLLFGCYGLPTESDCARALNPAEQMDCYNSLAILQAYTTTDESIPMYSCNQIKKIGTNYPNTDFEKYSVEQSNTCYYVVAITLTKTTGSNNYLYICDYIDDGGVKFSGSATTKALCRDQVDRMKDLNPNDYYNPASGKTNICSAVVFVLVPLFGYLFVKLVH